MATTNVAVRDPSTTDHVERDNDDEATVSAPTSIIEEDDDDSDDTVVVVVIVVDGTMSSPISEFVCDHTSNDR